MSSLAFLAIPLFDMLMFTTFITAALALRRHKEAHKRLMLLAYGQEPPEFRHLPDENPRTVPLHETRATTV